MLILITIILVLLTFVFYKTKKSRLYKLFVAYSFMIGIVTLVILVIYLAKFLTTPDLNECRQKKEVAQEEMQQLKKELIEKDSLDEETVNQFLKNYSKAKNLVKSYTYLIEENEYYLEGGGKEKIEFWLFFNLF